MAHDPGCLSPTNTVYKLWKTKNSTCKGGALVILWYGQAPSAAFDVIPFSNASTKLKPYEPPPAKKRGGKERNWASARRDDGRRREHRGEEVRSCAARV